MKTIKTLALILAILFGVFMVIFGEYDDSPGAQGLGLILAIVGIFYLVKSKTAGLAIDI